MTVHVVFSALLAALLQTPGAALLASRSWVSVTRKSRFTPDFNDGLWGRSPAFNLLYPKLSAAACSHAGLPPAVAAPPPRQLVVGLNKYSHDAAVCVVDGITGAVLFAAEKERLTRVKHDGGDTGDLVSHALGCLSADLTDVALVVENSHLRRVGPFEATLPLSVALRHYAPSYLDEENLLPGTRHVELSHHLAHAWCAAATSPWFHDDGSSNGVDLSLVDSYAGGDGGSGGDGKLASTLVVVMDGMGEARSSMTKGLAEGQPAGVDYVHDLLLGADALQECGDGCSFPPSALVPDGGWREAESAYLVDDLQGDWLPPSRKNTFSSAARVPISAAPLLGPSLEAGLGALGLVRPLWKRWVGTDVHAPEAENFGFGQMESLGAVYSRAASHVFGDWNVCGKVMGLAPWAPVWRARLHEKISGSGTPSPAAVGAASAAASPSPPTRDLFSGSFAGGDLRVDWGSVAALEASALQRNAWQDPTDDDADGAGDSNDAAAWSHAASCAALASQVQANLEARALELVGGLKAATGATRLCLAGGVAQNSVLNGRIMRELGFDRVHVPSCPGDEGVAMGCALFGAHYLATERRAAARAAEAAGSTAEAEAEATRRAVVAPDVVGRFPVSPYLGKAYGPRDVAAAVAEYNCWVEPARLDLDAAPAALVAVALNELRAAKAFKVKAAATQAEAIGNEGDNEEADEEAVARVAAAAAVALSNGEVVGWFDGRSEFGPRALGGRSLLADPRNATLARLLNRDVKRREAFRPFAPAVLAEEASKWFDGITVDGSPCMGVTCPIAYGKRSLVPAVVHGADGSARLQTVSRGLAPAAFRALLAAFFALTGVPMVLNTSFNVLRGEPIVESPGDALRAFLAAHDKRGTPAAKRVDKVAFLGSCPPLLLAPRPCPLDVERLVALSAAHRRSAKGDGGAWGLGEVGCRVPVRRVTSFTSEVRSHTAASATSATTKRLASATTEVGRVRVRVAGVVSEGPAWVALFDDLELALLEACNGDKAVDDLLDDFVTSDDDDDDDDDDGDGDDHDRRDGHGEFDGEVGSEVTVAEVLLRLRQLWGATLVEL